LRAAAAFHLLTAMMKPSIMPRRKTVLTIEIVRGEVVLRCPCGLTITQRLRQEIAPSCPRCGREWR
jgi:hypothetical protein